MQNNSQKPPKNKFLLVVAGPTAVGKTELCLRLAAHFDTEVLSADSRQLFREMYIGTARPLPEELRGIPHHFLGSHSIHEPYSVGHFEREALALLDRLFQQKDIVLLTGGSGLYIQTLCQGIDPMPAPAPEIRQELQTMLEKEGLVALLERLEALDPLYFAEVDKQNPQRIVRALEVCLSTGKPFSDFRQGHKAARPFQSIKIGLERPREELYERINRRVEQMLAQGLLAEAQALFDYRQHNALQTVGYQEIYAFMEGQYDWEECVRLIKRNTRHYAKRQMTWFRRDTDLHWFHPEQEAAIIAHVEQRIEGLDF
jgi:tRNA dimethylallyltransferase